MTINYLEELLHPAECPECGKVFELRFAEEYVFKHKLNGKMRYWCSWHCWRASQSKIDKKRIPQMTCDQIMKMYEQGGKTVKQIADETGVSSWFAGNYLKRQGFEPRKRRKKNV